MSGQRLLLNARRARRSLRRDAGFGLIEMLIALTLISVGIAAALSVFGSSIVSLQHAAKEGSALALADRQLEAYRAMPNECLPQDLVANLGYTTPAQALPTGSISSTCASPYTPPSYTDPRDPTNTTPFPNPYAAVQNVSTTVSPDHRAYTVTTDPTANSSYCGGALQIVISVTLQNATEILARETSCFSEAGTAPGT
jgi:prepilin-type N-terminal cleavage/methylation domain-containing protein